MAKYTKATATEIARIHLDNHDMEIRYFNETTGGNQGQLLINNLLQDNPGLDPSIFDPVPDGNGTENQKGDAES